MVSRLGAAALASREEDHPRRPTSLSSASVEEIDLRQQDELRLWLRLLSLTNLIEGEVRQRLRRRFGVTLPRFDVMAQLARSADGMSLSELSKRMMVSNGNITGLVDTLVASGHVERRTDAEDRRARVVRLTALGRRSFSRMAVEHKAWISQLLAEVSGADLAALSRSVERAKASVVRAVSRNDV
jgi:DNA-binding MarR family transcriptional regulator